MIVLRMSTYIRSLFRVLKARGGDDPTGPTGGCVQRWGIITGSGA